jgi:hypothetical protein
MYGCLTGFFFCCPTTRHEGAWGESSIAPTHSRTRHSMGMSGLRHAPAALYPRVKDPGTHCTGGWVGPRAGLDTEARGKIISSLRGIEALSPSVGLLNENN